MRGGGMARTPREELRRLLACPGERLLSGRVLAQVKLVKEGKPYVMFGDGTLASCKPISEADLAAFMADCVAEPDKANRVLPVGGALPASAAARNSSSGRAC